MGWWGFGIMEGDEPLDILHDWEEFAGNREVPSKESVRFIKQLSYEFDSAIVAQVVGYQVMLHQHPMGKGLRKRILAGIANDDWDTHDRLKALAGFKKNVKHYDGKKEKLAEQRGLFDTLSTHRPQ